jgi:uncharacterized phage protein (TIGR01671 family)
MIQWERDPNGESEAHQKGVKSAVGRYGWDAIFNNSIMMQYTGLKDRNGKEIYEGDIVQEHHGGLAFEADFFQLKVVKWVAFGFMPFQRVIGGTAHDYANNLKEYIVIGNIYENPELIA